MKKKIFKGLLMAGLILGSAQFNKTFAQFDVENLGFGAGIGYTGHSASLGGSVSYNIRGHYMFDESNAVTVGFNSQVPLSFNANITATAFSSATIPYFTDATLEQKVSFYNISLDYNRYFIGDLEESFGLYGLAGVGLTFASIETSTSGYDKNTYSTGINDESEAITGFMINLGLGTNFSLSDKLALFTEARIAIPAGNEYNSRGNTITNPIPFNYSIGLGLRYSPWY